MPGSARGACCRLGPPPVRLALAAGGGPAERFGEHGGLGAGLAGVVGPGGGDAGHTNRQIARALFISEKTASVHVTNLLRKLGVTNRYAAAAAGARAGISP